MFADGFVWLIAEDAFGAGVPTANNAVERLADDGVIGRFDDGRERDLGLPRRRRMAADAGARPPQEDEEQHHLRERPQRRAERQVVKPRVLADESQPSKQQGYQQDRHKKLPEYRAAGIVSS